MKKKIRSIIVEGSKFNWRVNALDENFVSLRIWIDGIKQMPWFTVRYPYRDPWLNFAEIVERSGGFHEFKDDSILQGVTPGKIAKIINHVIEIVGLPTEVKKTTSLEWDNLNECPKI